ncbi:MAG: acyl-CoA thioesterase [Alphaproteobacteria bacterium]
MAGWIETYRGMVYPWQCDHQGHMNVMHYVGMFDQAGWHLLNACGLGSETLAATNRGFVSAKDTLEYFAELRAGSLVMVQSGVGRVGTTSFILLQRMKDAATDALAARHESVGVHFDLKARAKLPIPDGDRARLAAHIVDPSVD